MVYLLEESDGLTGDFLRQARPLLSLQRLEKIQRYGAERDKMNGCGAYLLLRYGLWREYGITQAPVFVFGKHEKPFLADTPSVYFNLSHCKTAVACIVSEQETAIDVTDRRKVHPHISRRVCSPEEQARIAVSRDPQTCFLKMWTRKECLAKLTGEGMSRPFHTITDDWPQAAFVHTEDRSGCILSYYAKEEQTILSLSANALLTELLKNCR